MKRPRNGCRTSRRLETATRNHVNAQLGEIVGSDHVVVEPEVMASYAIDWTGRFRGHPRAVVRPGDGHEVAAVVALCKEAGVALPQGVTRGSSAEGLPWPANV